MWNAITLAFILGLLFQQWGVVYSIVKWVGGAMTVTYVLATVLFKGSAACSMAAMVSAYGPRGGKAAGEQLKKMD